MNYNEFPIIKEKYTPIYVDPIERSNHHQIDSHLVPFYKIKEVIVEKEVNIETIKEVQVIKEIEKEIIKEIVKEVVVPHYITIESPTPKKKRKKYELLTFPTHWNNKLKAKYKSYYYRAKQKGKQFSLSFQEFENLLQKECKFCGSNDSITIDRIDSNIGYESFNCQPCCLTCNIMKYTQTEYNFLDKIAKIYHHQTNPPLPSLGG